VSIPEGHYLTDTEYQERKAIFDAQETAGRALEQNPLDPFALALHQEACEEFRLFWERVRAG